MEGFRDNWSYLKVELNWLERLLVTALSKYRQDKREVERLAKSRADQAASHWWKGLVSLEGGGYDSPKPTSSSPMSSGHQSYQQQLESRIRASQAQGVALALPMLVDRWQLSLVEKQTLLLALAPEVHRRYGDMYAVLTEQSMLPTLDLALRLFCRDDRTWQLGRTQLLHGTLAQQGLLQILEPVPFQSGLQRSLRLHDRLTSFLLSSDPPTQWLDQWGLSSGQPDLSAWVKFIEPHPVLEADAKTASNPESQAEANIPLENLATLKRFPIGSMSGRNDLRPKEGWVPERASGEQWLFVGRSELEKHQTITQLARQYQLPVCQIHLAEVEPGQFPALLSYLVQLQPTLLWLQGCDHWFRRDCSLTPPQIQTFLTSRHHPGQLTLFSLEVAIGIPLIWRRSLTGELTLQSRKR
ncbi:MAG: hypothetical protein VKJ24_16825 [Synechococcales bacterium]|nr:hypothetical protein [Synechococcales bacterium]